MDKQFILNELKRVAAENGGDAPGRMRFARLTGIRETDWSGRYWVRWSDAVEEAGLTPNKLAVSFPEEMLLAKYCALAAELGHIPTLAEIKMKGRSDRDFPSHNTFSRLGSKSERLRKLADYCRNQDAFPDVLASCERALIEPRAVVEDGRPHLPDENFGFVYLIKSGKFYKLGKSNAVGRRERELAIQLPEKSKTVHTIRTDDPSGIEAYWHKRFEAKRMNGEWFNLTAEDVNAFRRRKFM